MEHIKKQFLEDLVTRKPELLASIWIIDRVPIPFQGDAVKYAEWKMKLASLLNVDSSEIIITGSSAFGVSLNPNKNYRFFDQDSDIDVAIISEFFFNTAWRYMRQTGTKQHGMTQAAKQAVKDHVNKYTYWGTIATDRLLPYLPFGKEWGRALDEMSKSGVTENRDIKARIYKDFDSLRAYQVNNLKNLRMQELERGIDNV